MPETVRTPLASRTETVSPKSNGRAGLKIKLWASVESSHSPSWTPLEVPTTEGLASAALRIRPTATGRGSGKMAERPASAFRALPIPVIGRIRDGALIFDLRCLEDPGPFTAQLDALNISGSKRR